MKKNMLNVITKAFVFDFDDTLALTNATVKVGGVALTPSEFNTYTLKAGESFDFSEFSKPSLILDGTPLSLIDLARAVSDEGHSVFILTARANCVASAIAEFHAGQGVAVNAVHCVGSATGGDIAKAKRKVLLSIIENFTKVWFYDDDARNIEIANDLDLTAIKQ